MRRFFRAFVSRNLPHGAALTGLKIQNHGLFLFKRAVRYRLTARLPSGKLQTLLLRGNVPSVDTVREVRVADQLLKALTAAGFSSGALRVPRSYGAHPRLRLLIYEEVQGVSLRDLLVGNRPQSASALQQTGRWLNKLHQKKLQVGSRRRFADVSREAGFFLDDFRRYCPLLVPRVAPLLEQLVRLQERFWPAQLRAARTVHGDYKPGNLILDGLTTTAIDFGNSRMADPLSDVGNFLAQLADLGWRHGWPASRVRRYQKIFLAAYAPARAWQTAERRRLLCHQAWWQMQLLAYAVSTATPAVYQHLVPNALKSIEKLLVTLGVDWLPWEKSGRVFEKFLHDERALITFFRAHPSSFFPGGDELLSLTSRFPSAFSQDSRLTRLTITLRMLNGRIVTRTVRGNRVPGVDAAILQQLTRRQTILVPRPLWYSRRSHYLFYEELPGRRLREVPFRVAALRPVVREIGRTLAVLHREPVRGIGALPWSAERKTLRNIRRWIARARLANDAQLRRLQQALEAWERREWTHLPQVIAHNDFQGSNILWTKTRRIGLIDFSRSGRGPLPIDAGQFLTHLTVMLAPNISPTGRQQLRRVFLQAYRRGLPAAWREKFDRSLSGFALRTALDIIAISCNHLDAKTRDRVLAPLMNNLPQLPA